MEQITPNREHLFSFCQGKPCFFLSPHLDDAVFSVGSFLATLSPQTNVTVITLFTEATPPPYSFSAKQYLRHCNQQTATALFAERRNEDIKALHAIGVDAEHLGLTDALFRKKEHLTPWQQLIAKLVPEAGLVYKTYKFGVQRGYIAKADSEIISQTVTLLQNRLPANAVVFAPLADGNHVDHVITRQIAEQLGQQVLYWRDFPYVLKKSAAHVPKNMLALSLPTDQAVRKTGIERYQTQRNAMFPTNIPAFTEQLLLPKQLFRPEP